ncbi:MAG: hypothetical protein CMO38_06195 [Verrucomicrobiaceae bacterium]|nr:hypothetical protein [Verrucomicrobiaceae bacterium]
MISVDYSSKNLTTFLQKLEVNKRTIYHLNESQKMPLLESVNVQLMSYLQTLLDNLINPAILLIQNSVQLF